MKDNITIPAEFWRTLSNGEMAAICISGMLDANQCARLWDMLDLTDDPPVSMTVMVRRDDVMRLWPPK